MHSVCVIGLGKLGACFAAVLADRGAYVHGVDTNKRVVDLIHRGESPYEEPGLADLLAQRKIKAGHVPPTECDAYVVIVPTPSLPTGAFDPTFVIAAIESVPTDAPIIVVSTLSPGTTERLNKIANVTYAPTLVALGSVIHDITRAPFTLIGATDRRGEAAAVDLWHTLNPYATCLVGTPVEVEIAKLAINCYVTMKISFANSLTELCEHTPYADADNVLQLVGEDERIGHAYLRPGTAYGGPCFPRDNRALQAHAFVSDVELPLAAATEDVNNDAHTGIIERVAAVAPLGSTVAVLGLSYKAGTPVQEESASHTIVAALKQRGYDVRTHDVYRDGPDWSAAIEKAVCIVVATPHAEYRWLRTDAPVIDPWRLLA